MGSKMSPPRPDSSSANTLATGIRGQSWLRKLFAFLLGCAFLVVLSEWMLGVAYRQFIAAQDAEAAVRVTDAENEIRVLAIGESTTAVAGNDTGSLLIRETAYPPQLEKILNTRQDQFRFVVINRGGMGGDTDRVLDTLPGYLDNYRPHLILVMMGMKDQVLPADPGQKSADARREDNTQGRFRTVRLARMLFELVRDGSGDLEVGFATSMTDLPVRLQSQFEQALRENEKLTREAETAVAQRERDLQRFQEEKQFNLDQLHEAKDRERQREDEVYDLRESERQLLDKVKRLEMSVANKSSEIESLEKMLTAERERREAENGEIRNMLYQE